MKISETIKSKNNEFYKEYNWNPETWISISNIKEFVKIPFDKEGVAKKTFEKHFENKDSEYYHMTIEDILKKWSDKAERSLHNGTLCDTYIEKIFECQETEKFKQVILSENEDMTRKFIGIENCLKDFQSREFIFDTREEKLLLPYEYKGKTYIINGRLDAIFTKNEKIILIDWKNSEEIKSSNKWQKLLGPCNHLDECDLNLFTIQLYLYKYMLHNIYGFNTEILSYIIQFPSHKDYYYKVFKPNFEYDEEMLKKIIEFSIDEKIKKEVV